MPRGIYKHNKLTKKHKKNIRELKEGKRMKLENQVTCRELSQKLRKLGVPQVSVWWWHYNKKSRKWYIDRHLGGRFPNPRSSISAPTLPELLEKIPSPLSLGGSELYFGMGKHNDLFHCGYCFDDGNWVYGEDSICEGDKKYEFYIEDEENPANCMAKMLIYLLQHNIIKAGDLR